MFSILSLTWTVRPSWYEGAHAIVTSVVRVEAVFARAHHIHQVAGCPAGPWPYHPAFPPSLRHERGADVTVQARVRETKFIW